ncbi:MAG TPA: hypothetical protein VGI93_18445 [Steroidobacteraceae bacterium]
MAVRSKAPAAPARRSGWRSLRILILLLILLVVAAKSWQDQYLSRRWNVPLYVSIYPIAADDSPVTRRYLDGLDAERFKSIDAFFIREAAKYHLRIDEPFRTHLREELHELPPQHDPSASVLSTMLWSLKLRYWAWRHSGHVQGPEDIRVFVLYADPALTPSVPHSLGLMKGLIGVVYAFATPQMNEDNDVIIAHELLHTLGATDKYDPASNAPIFPIGYGDPEQKPLYPQQVAEIMAGRLALAPDRFEQAESLNEVVVGPATALEIRWPQHAKP